MSINVNCHVILFIKESYSKKIKEEVFKFYPLLNPWSRLRARVENKIFFGMESLSDSRIFLGGTGDFFGYFYLPRTTK